MSEVRTPGERVLVLMTNARDAERTLAVLAAAGLQGVACTDGPHLCRELTSDVGVVLLSEETILADGERRIQEALLAQPAWSSVPLVAVTREGAAEDRRESLLTDLAANVTLIERPVRMRTLVSVVRGALRARRHQYEARDAIAERELALDAARLGWWRYDPATGIVTHDERYGEIYGIVGRSRPVEDISPLLHPEDSPRVLAAVEAAMDPLDPRPYAVEYRVNRPDGALRWLEARGLATFDGEGAARRMTSFVGTVADVTDRKVAEEQLRRNQETFYHLIQNNPFGIYVIDADFRLHVVSKGAQKVFCNVRPLLGRDFAEVLRTIWAEPFASEAIGRFRRTLETGEPYGAPTTEQRNDVAAMESYDWQIERVVLPDGRYGVVCYFYDLTEVNRIEATLRTSEERFKTAVAATSEILWTNDATGRMTRYQPGWGDFTGQTPDEYEGYGWANAIHPDDAPATVEAWNRAVSEREMFVFEHRVRRHDGVYRTFSVRAVPLVNSDDTVREWVGTHTDITDRKRAEEELREADRRKDEFLATLAHELRNPLAPIRTGLGVLRLTGLNADAENVVSVMDRQLAQLVGIVDDLLDVARVTSGKIVLRPQPLDLREAVEAAIETSRPSIECGSHVLEVHLTDEPLPVNGDRTRLSQVVTNVLTNACKYTPDGGRIELATERDDDHAVVRVVDNGIGIPADMLPKVFDTFTQVGRALDRSQGGLGLGLSLVRRLVEKHGGKVFVDSPGPGGGSTFTIRLPLSESGPETGVSSSIPNSRSATAPSPVRRVLVVDDLKPAADLLEMMLKRLGQETRVVYDGPSALKAMAEFQPDVVISDIGMQGMDGYELARRARSMFAPSPVLVALTGYGQVEDQRRAFDAGFDHHLVKPSSVDALRQLLLMIPTRAADSAAPS